MSVRPFVPSASLAMVVVLLVGWTLFEGWAALGLAGDDGMDIEQGRVVWVQPGSVADQSKIRVGDSILSQDGGSPNQLAERAGQHTTFAVKHEPTGTFELIDIPNLPPATSGWGFRLEFAVVDTLVALVSVVVGLTTVWLRPAEFAPRLFLFVMGTIALVCTLSTWGNNTGYDRWFLAAFFLTLVIGASAVLHLFLFFPQPSTVVERAAALGPAGWRVDAVVVGCVYGLPAIGAGWLVSDGSFDRAAWNFVLATLVLTAAGVVLWRAYRRPATELTRAQVRWILIGFIPPVVVLAFATTIPELTEGLIRPVPLFAAVGAWAWFPIATAFAVLRFRLFNVNQHLADTIFYSLVFVIGLLLLSLAEIGVEHAKESIRSLLPGDAVDALPGIIVAGLLLVGGILLHERMKDAIYGWLYRGREVRNELVLEASTTLDEAAGLAGAAAATKVAAFLTTRVPQALGLGGSGLVVTSRELQLLLGKAIVGGVQPVRGLGERVADVEGPRLLVDAADREAFAGAPVMLTTESWAAEWYQCDTRLVMPLRGMAVGAAETPAHRRNRRARGDGAPGRQLLAVWTLSGRASKEPLDEGDLKTVEHVGRMAALHLDNVCLARARV